MGKSSLLMRMQIKAETSARQKAAQISGQRLDSSLATGLGIAFFVCTCYIVNEYSEWFCCNQVVPVDDQEPFHSSARAF